MFKAGSTLKFTSVNQEFQYCFFVVQPIKKEVTVMGKTDKCISMKYFLLSKIWKSTGFLNHKISFIPQYNLQQLHAKAWWFYNPQNVLSYLPSSHAMIGSRSGSWVIAQCFHLASRSAVLSFCLTKTRKISCSSISILCLYRYLLKIKIFSA